MHELTLASELVKIISQVVRDNGNTRPQSALIELGVLTHVEPETLRFAFEVVSKETPAEGCQLVFQRVEVAARCPRCNWCGPPVDGLCGGCGGHGLEILTGREMRLVSVDVED